SKRIDTLKLCDLSSTRVSLASSDAVVKLDACTVTHCLFAGDLLSEFTGCRPHRVSWILGRKRFQKAWRLKYPSRPLRPGFLELQRLQKPLDLPAPGRMTRSPRSDHECWHYESHLPKLLQ